MAFKVSSHQVQSKSKLKKEQVEDEISAPIQIQNSNYGFSLHFPALNPTCNRDQPLNLSSLSVGNADHINAYIWSCLFVANQGRRAGE